MTKQEILGLLENILFISGESVKISEFARFVGEDINYIKSIINERVSEQDNEYGIMLKIFEGEKIQLSTRSDYSNQIVEFLGEKNEAELSKATMETLAIIAFKQPVTRDDIEKIRGVSSSYTINTLLEKKLIYVAGRKDAIGKPKLYATTEEFLRYFDISSLTDLPEIAELEEEIDDENKKEVDSEQISLFSETINSEE